MMHIRKTTTLYSDDNVHEEQWVNLYVCSLSHARPCKRLLSGFLGDGVIRDSSEGGGSYLKGYVFPDQVNLKK